MNSKIVNPPNIGWIESKLEQPVIDFLWDIINDANNDYKGNLAGNISKSLKLVDKNNYFFNNIALPHSKAYLEKFKSPFIRQFESKKKPSISLENLWVNYQYQHEFNPFHCHTGIFSFAIWLQIPTTWSTQSKLPFLDGIEESNKKAGCFEFQYTNTLGQITTSLYRLDKSNEGTMLFFPAQLQHAVHPFYNCKDGRISIAGNLALI